MTEQLKTSIVINLSGNLQKQAGRYGTALKKFSTVGKRSINILKKSAAGLGNVLDKAGNRYTALISGAGAGVAIKQVAALNDELIQLGIQSNKSQEEIDALKKEIFAAATQPDIRLDPAQLLAAVNEIVEKTGDLEFASNNIRNIGLAIRATNAEGGAIGGILAEFQKLGITAPAEVLKAIDTLNSQGKEGAFTLQNLASLGPRVVQAYASMGREGPKAIREMGAALQVIRQGTGSSEQAATAFEAVLATFSDKAKVAKLEAAGIKVFEDEDQTRMRSIIDLMPEIIKAANGSKVALSSIFGQEAIRGFNSAVGEFSRGGEVTSFKKFFDVTGDGTQTLDDAARAATKASAATQQLLTTIKKISNETLSGPIDAVVNSLNSLEPGTLEKAVKISAGVATTLAAVVGVRKIGKKFGGKSSLASTVAGAVKPIPVFVVNQPAGFGLDGPAGKASKKASLLSRTKGVLGRSKSLIGRAAVGAGALATSAGGIATGGVLASGAAGFGVGTLLNKLIDQTVIGDAIGFAIGKSLGFVGIGDAGELARQQRDNPVGQFVGGKITLEVEDNRIRVKKLTKEGAVDLEVSTGAPAL